MSTVKGEVELGRADARVHDIGMIDQETDQESMTNMEGTTRARQLEAHGHITAFRPTTVTVTAETIATVHRQTKCPMWTGQINGKGAP